MRTLQQLKKCARFEVWRDAEFQVSANADLIVNGALKDRLQSAEAKSTTVRDHGHSKSTSSFTTSKPRTLRAYEVKRGFGSYAPENVGRFCATRFAYRSC